MRTKVVLFLFFSKSFQTKKIKALRPKMTKIASGGSALINKILYRKLVLVFGTVILEIFVSD